MGGLVNIMKFLDTQFTHDERKLRQLDRSAKSAIYELKGEHELTYGYELIKITVHKARECYGKLVTERELYPPNSQFGRLGWSYGSGDKSAAFQHFDRLVQAEESNADVNGVPTVLAPVEPEAPLLEFRRAGRTYTQLKRDGHVALYKVAGAGYEVVVLQRIKLRCSRVTPTLTGK